MTLKPELAKVLAQVEAAGYDPTRLLSVLLLENDPEYIFAALTTVYRFYKRNCPNPQYPVINCTYEAVYALSPACVRSRDTLTIADGDPSTDLPI